jgi:hypothetical protein
MMQVFTGLKIDVSDIGFKFTNLNIRGVEK